AALSTLRIDDPQPLATFEVKPSTAGGRNESLHGHPPLDPSHTRHCEVRSGTNALYQRSRPSRISPGDARGSTQLPANVRALCARTKGVGRCPLAVRGGCKAASSSSLRASFSLPCAFLVPSSRSGLPSRSSTRPAWF